MDVPELGTAVSTSARPLDARAESPQATLPQSRPHRALCGHTSELP